MPVTGRKPKPDGQKRHSHAPRHDWVDVVDQPYSGPKPDLPERRGGWPARAEQKWAIWSAMPHCVLWAESDWQFALDTIEVAAQFHDGNERLAAELRNREKVLGTTLDYRRDLRIRYVDHQAKEERADVASLDDYRDRL